MDLIILAGGYATRLGELTKKTPKILLKFEGKTFLEHQLETVIHSYDNIIYSLGHFSEPIINILETHRYSAKLKYVLDKLQGCGTGAATMNCFSKLSDPFAVMYGDSYLLCDHKDVQSKYINSSNSCAMVLCKANGYDKNNVYYHNHLVKVYDKSKSNNKINYLDYGLNFFSKIAFEKFRERNSFDLALVHQENIKNDAVFGIPVGKKYFEIGSKIGQEHFTNYLIANNLTKIEEK